MFYEGQQFGEYTLIKKLGRGGFGEVWLAESEFELFAIKFPFKDQVDWKSITQEIGLWTLCGKHPNVMPLVGARNFDGQIAIISEYAPDGSLEDLLRKKESLSELEAVAITIDILEGLQHLHKSGIIHRDLKPANILLDGETPRLTDFGVSRIISANSLSETVAGTFSYMAPECFDGKRNVQTDIWSVGVILYRMITGSLPFPQKEMTALIASIVIGEFDNIEKLQNLIAQNSSQSNTLSEEIYDLAKPYISFAYEIYRHTYARDRNLPFDDEVSKTLNRFRDSYDFSEDELIKITPYIFRGFADIEKGRIDLEQQLFRLRSQCNRGISGDLFKMIAIALRKKPEKRYQSTREMLNIFEDWYNSENLRNMNRLRNKARLESRKTEWENQD